MEVVPYYYKNNEYPAAFVIKNIFTKMTSESYRLYYRSTDLMKEEFPPPPNIKLNLDESSTYFSYCDSLGLSILESLTNEVSKIVKDEVLPSYSYTRVYTKGSELTSHQDRASCEISITVSLYDSNQNGVQYLYISDKDKKDSAKEDILAIPISVGDGLVFFGSQYNNGYWHWRDSLDSDWILQLFLHYVKKDGEFKNNSYEWLKGNE
jgi:hypothetical protein